jgi:hypothetical protein
LQASPEQHSTAADPLYCRTSFLPRLLRRLTHGHRFVRVNVLRYSLTSFLFFLLELTQCSNGQSFRVFLIDLLFLLNLAFLAQVLATPALPAVLCVAYEVAETISWFYTQTGITFRLLAAIDLRYSFQEMQFYALTVAILVFLTAAFSYFPLGPRYAFLIHSSVIPLLFLCQAILSLMFLQDKLDILYPFRRATKTRTSSTARILNSFNHKMAVTARTGRLRNLILFEVESLELAYIGKFNRYFPQSMPYLSATTENSTYFTRIASQPYTTWSAAGLFATQCGFPLLVSDVHWNVRQHLDYDGFSKVHCIPNFLDALGYKMFAYCSGACDIMRMKDFMIERGFKTQDSTEHHRENDDQLFEYLENDILPGLLNRQNQPFVLLIVNADTHPDFTIGPQCDDYLVQHNYPKVYRSFTCFDQHLQRFMAKLSSLGLDQDTEVVVYGDHLTMFAVETLMSTPRNLTMFLPLRRQDEKWQKAQERKTMSYYDFAPTILELLGIDYTPPFAFGKDILGDEVGTVPTLDDLKLLYGLATGDTENATVRCLGNAGFCQSNEY